MSFSNTHHTFCVELAIQYGMEKAALIHHFQHWIKLNRRKKSQKHFKENRWWTYQTHADIHDFLPYLSEREIKHLMDQLTNEDGIFIKANFNKSAIDKTTWYAFKDEKKFLDDGEDSNNDYERQKCPSTDKNGCPWDKFVPPIPDPKPDTISTDNNKRERTASTPAPFYKSYNKVKIKQEKYDTLVAEYGEEKIKEMMERLDDYGDIKPKKFKEYGCHGAVIRKWLKEEQKKVINNDKINDEQENHKIAEQVVHNFPQAAEKNHIQIQKTGLLFCYGKVYELIEFRDIEFRDKLTYRLTKMNLDIGEIC